MDGSEPWQAIRASVASVRQSADTIAVAVVANLKGTGQAGLDYPETSIETEYFSEGEAAQLLIGLQENGFYTRFYAGEMEFIQAVLSGDFERMPRPRKLVYNLAQSGTAPGRKSLVPAFCALRGIRALNSNAYVVSL